MREKLEVLKEKYAENIDSIIEEKLLKLVTSCFENKDYELYALIMEKMYKGYDDVAEIVEYLNRNGYEVYFTQPDFETSNIKFDNDNITINLNVKLDNIKLVVNKHMYEL